MSELPSSELLPPDYAVVIPSLGRPSLQRLLDTLAAQHEPLPREVVVVDDRAEAPDELKLTVDAALPWAARVLRGHGRGPAAARNAGWRVTSTPWVCFLDDDVELPADWSQHLAADLSAAGPGVGGSQARLHVPLPVHRRPTDWERGTAGLRDAAWATADMAYRRCALEQVHGFDERFPRAYREDADLALRVQRAGWVLQRGRRTTVHPVRPADDWVSLRVQRGNTDDALARRLHGRGWRAVAQAPPGRLRWHAVTTAAAGVAAAALLSRRRWVAASAGLLWGGLTGDFARRRLAPGPRPSEEQWWPELRRMATTSVAIPPAAVWHRARGEWRHRRGADPWPPPLRAVLFDRDGTLVHDVPYNGEPDAVRAVDSARPALDLVRAAGLATGVISNQSGIARGLLSREQVDAVNARVAAELGPFDTWQVCPHGPEDGCPCRKPRPGLVLQAARELGVRPEQCAVIGDIGADVQAARAAGARAVLVPTPVTLAEEVSAAPVVAPDLYAAVTTLLAGPAAPGAPR
ncbi:HAD-IIIA family hydrolase [Rhodococcus sp. X156]|uniref:HAD-IIIA family hydrolase n=1 Tax=Rhodococcus sp. X156 TaxID=2499145 RepID=UPI000FD8ED4D|nr:HAD-IIIA family hydrolase [Rhodococcus sp. X156]